MQRDRSGNRQLQSIGHMVSRRGSHQPDRPLYRAGGGRSRRRDGDQRAKSHSVWTGNNHSAGGAGLVGYLGLCHLQPVDRGYWSNLPMQRNRSGNGQFQSVSHMVGKRGNHQPDRPFHRAGGGWRRDGDRDQRAKYVYLGRGDAYRADTNHNPGNPVE